MGEKKRLIIIDANSVIHRAYHALPPLTTKKGEPVGAVYGFLLVFFRAVKEFQPNFLAACFDVKGPTLRHKEYREYKAKRPPMDQNLSWQIPKVKEALAAFNVTIFEKEGYEADDIIGTISESAKMPGIETIILSGDSDILQLVDSQTEVYLLRKGVKDVVLYDNNLTKEKFGGLEVRQIVDFKALRGDPADNIPGVAGIGEKTATRLLLEFGSLENLYRKIETVQPKTKELLLKYKEQAFISQSLAKIKKDAPIGFNLAECDFKKYDKNKAIAVLEVFGFQSLTGRLAEIK